MTKKIRLTKGFSAIVDDNDFGFINSMSWHYQPKRKTGYAIGHVIINGKRTTRRMHRIIMKAKKNEQIDHVNGNGLDNRRVNLRIATAKMNAINRRSKPKSGYKGVSLIQITKSGKKLFTARIGPRLKHKTIGYFNCVKKAAMAYDREAKKMYGNLSVLNLKR